jgi:electron transfer flavoprotein alpha subunit
MNDIWLLIQHREGSIEENSFGLISEARRILFDLGEEGIVSAIALGLDLKEELSSLGAYGVDRVLYVESELLCRYQGELFTKVLSKLAKKHKPTCILMAQTAETSDLSARLAASLETALVTHTMDLNIDSSRKFHAIRPVANGYLFESISLECSDAPVISFLPSVLTSQEPDQATQTEILIETLEEQLYELKTKVIKIIEADPEELDIEESDIIVSAGRGVGRDEAFNIIHELARTIGGSVAGTRPVIDWQTLPYERQIGQTGKTVIPRLIINCGISGANEYTAGMEKSQLVVAINTDPRARIFRFADLGVIGDVHELLPILIERLQELAVGD